MNKNLIKNYLLEAFVSETKIKGTGDVPGVKVTAKVTKKSGSENKAGVKEIGVDMKAYEKASTKSDINGDEMATNKFNYSNDNEKDYHDEMEIMNGQEMIQYDRTPDENFKKRALEALEGSSRMGNNPEWANVVEKGWGGDPEFGKNLVKKIKASEKKRDEQTPTIHLQGRDIEADRKDYGNKPYTFESVNEASKLGKGYTHFAIDKETNKIVDGWDYKKSSKDEIVHYSKIDLKDNFPDRKPSEFKIVSRKYLMDKSIDPSNTNNWYKIEEPAKIDEVDEVETNDDETILEFTIPDWALSSLINGDNSGLDPEDEEKLKNFVNKVHQRFGNANFMLSDEENMDLGFKHRNDIDNLGANCSMLLLRPSKETNDGENINENKKIKQPEEKMKRLKFKKEFKGVGNALKLIPESYRTDMKVFEMTDGNESYKIRWEGSLTEGTAVILTASDKKMVNEDVQRMKALFNYKSQDTLGLVKGKDR
jgi:hypothetical protein